MQSTYWLEKVLKMISLYVNALLCTLRHIVIHAMQLSGVNSPNSQVHSPRPTPTLANESASRFIVRHPVSIQHLVYVVYRSERKFLSDLHTKRSPTQSDIYQMTYWYNWYSWWWALVCSKHVENRNKYTYKRNCGHIGHLPRTVRISAVNYTKDGK